MPRKIKGVKWSVMFKGAQCIAAYQGPYKCRLFDKASGNEIIITAKEKEDIDAQVDAGAPLHTMTAA